MSYLITFLLLLASAFFSGLTLGLMSLSAPELKRKMQLGDQEAAKVYSVRKRGNLLLTTLLIGNVAVNAALSIYLGSIASGLLAGVIATGLIVIFGEILPQAIFSRYALKLGAKVAWLVRIIVLMLYPICMPIAWILNKTLGKELSTIYSKAELIKIIEEHEEAHDSDIDSEEERIVKGALSFSQKRVHDVMTPKKVVFAIESSQKITANLLSQIAASGHTRVPVYKNSDDNIIGILYVKQLLGKDFIGKSIGSLAHHKIISIDAGESLDNALVSFLETRYHLYIVLDKNEFVGIVTLEDIIEQILRTEIIDETDKHPDMRKIASQK